MAYAAQSDLLLRVTEAQLAQLTDDTGRPPAIQPAVVQGALDRASGTIEGYCRSRYQTPLQTSQELTDICCDLAVYLLYSRRPQKMEETAKVRYDDAMRLLRDISTGKAQLDQPAGAPAQTPTGTAVRPTCDGLRFTERDLEGYV